MAQLPVDQAVQRFKGNEERFDSFVNDGDKVDVTTRNNQKYPTLQKAIKQMFENGGLPATPFKTKALMAASALVDGDYAIVTDDTGDKNGIYIKEGGVWIKSAYSPSRQAIQVIQSAKDFDLITYKGELL